MEGIERGREGGRERSSNLKEEEVKCEKKGSEKTVP